MIVYLTVIAKKLILRIPRGSFEDTPSMIFVEDYSRYGKGSLLHPPMAFQTGSTWLAPARGSKLNSTYVRDLWEQNSIMVST